MQEKSSMYTEEVKIALSASGKSKADAIANIFASLRKNIHDKIPGTIIYMEPVDVFINKIDVRNYTERFMFLFMPRKKQEIKLITTIIVNVKYIKY